MTCETILDRLADRVAERVGPVERAEIDRHLEVCAECRSEAEVLRALRIAGPATVPVGLEGRIRSAVAAEGAVGSGTDTLSITSGRGSRPGRVPSWALGAAAVFVLALGTPFLVDRMESPDAALSDGSELEADVPIASVWTSDDGLIAGAPALETLTDEELALLLEELEG